MKTKPTGAPTHEEISARARAIWEQEGRPDGKNAEHWLQAERELRDGLQQAPGDAGNAKNTGVPHTAMRDGAATSKGKVEKRPPAGK